MSNWARAIVVLDATDDPEVYRFVLAKRGKRSGWLNEDGEVVYARYFVRSKTGIRWAPATLEQVAALEIAQVTEKKKPGRKVKYSDSTLLKPLIGAENGLSFTHLRDELKATGCPIQPSSLWGRWQGWIEAGVLKQLDGDLYSYVPQQKSVIR